jgi:pseudo-rSAM protein
MPDGKIYANVNNVPLGSISDPICDLIYKEMTEGQSWLYIRDMKPCCDCVYQWLCPSPGSYEKVIGKSIYAMCLHRSITSLCIKEEPYE